MFILSLELHSNSMTADSSSLFFLYKPAYVFATGRILGMACTRMAAIILLASLSSSRPPIMQVLHKLKTEVDLSHVSAHIKARRINVPVVQVPLHLQFHLLNLRVGQLARVHLATAHAYLVLQLVDLALQPIYNKLRVELLIHKRLVLDKRHSLCESARRDRLVEVASLS